MRLRQQHFTGRTLSIVAMTGAAAAVLLAVSALAVSATRGGLSTGIITLPRDGAPYSFVENFADASDPPLTHLVATINPGDGSAPITPTISSPATGRYRLSASHTYADEGRFTITATIKDTSTHPATVTVSTSRVTVSEGDLTVRNSGITIGAGTATNFTVLSFTDGGMTETDNPYTARIAWGDGTIETGSVADGAVHSVGVPGSTHFYVSPGTYTTTVTVNETLVAQTPLFSATVPITVT
jgi:hypothetical protein